MLNDYITEYIAAKTRGDKETMNHIERDLSRLGMDRYTLQIITGGSRHDA